MAVFVLFYRASPLEYPQNVIKTFCILKMELLWHKVGLTLDIRYGGTVSKVTHDIDIHFSNLASGTVAKVTHDIDIHCSNLALSW